MSENIATTERAVVAFLALSPQTGNLPMRARGGSSRRAFAHWREATGAHSSRARQGFSSSRFLPPVFFSLSRRSRGGDEARERAQQALSRPPHFSFSFSFFPQPFLLLSPPPPPKQAFVSYERATGRPRGFGFVVFADPEVAARVVAQAHTIDRREVEAKRAVPKEESPLVPNGIGGAGIGAAAGPGAAAAAAAAAAALMLGSAQQQRHTQHQQLLLEQQQHAAAVVVSGSSPPPPPLLRQQQQQERQQLLSSPPPPGPSQQALAASLPSNLDLAAESSGITGGSGSEEASLLPQQQQQQTTTSSRKLFVGGLPPSCDDAALRAYFERFGPVDEAVVMVDHESKRSRG